jgi:hypothetical protein
VVGAFWVVGALAFKGFWAASFPEVFTAAFDVVGVGLGLGAGAFLASGAAGLGAEAFVAEALRALAGAVFRVLTSIK